MSLIVIADGGTVTLRGRAAACVRCIINQAHNINLYPVGHVELRFRGTEVIPRVYAALHMPRENNPGAIDKD